MKKPVYLSRCAIDRLLEACENGRETDLVLFLAGGSRLSAVADFAETNYFSELYCFKKIVARAGMPDILPHDLRYSFYVYEMCVVGGYDFSALPFVFENDRERSGRSESCAVGPADGLPLLNPEVPPDPRQV